MRIQRLLAMFVVATTATATFAVGAPASASVDDGLTTADVAAALSGVSDHLVSPASNSGADVRSDGTVHFTTPNAGDIIVALPNAHKAQAANGGLTYLNGNNATVAVPSQNGTAQVLLVAANPSAPTDYLFGVSNGYVASLPDGGLLLLDRNHQPSRVIPAPWAEDTDGKKVATSYTVNANGTGFTQTVTHNVAGVSYPVVADPWVSFFWGPAIFIGGWLLGNWLTGLAGYWIGCGSLITDPCRVR